PLIHVDNGAVFADEPLVVEIPIQITPDEFAMAFYYDVQTGELEGIPVAQLTTDRITFVTSHFSDFVITKIPWFILENVSADTGFVPGIDDWQFTNHGSYLAPKGHCAGQAISAMWYYYEQRLRAGEPPLYGRFDNNDYSLDTPYLWQDDSWGYRFASMVHDTLIDWDDRSRAFFKSMGEVSDRLTWGAFAYALLQTGEPQYVAIYNADGGHAMVVYKMAQGLLYVADPNYPGRTDRVIRFENGAFLPYYSGASATAISEQGESAYPHIRYMAKSVMTDWTAIGTEYQKVLAGTAGDDRFPDYKLEYLSDFNETTGEGIWSPAPDVLELTEEDTVKPGEGYRGQVVFRLTPLVGLGDVIGSLYEGANRVQYFSSSGVEHQVSFRYALTPGIHHLGVQFDDYEPVTADKGRINYIDFHRFKVIYEPEDLTGKWEGAWQIRSADKAQKYIKEMLVKLLMAFGVDEAKAWEAADAGFQEDPNLYNDRALTIIFERAEPNARDRYRMQVFMPDTDTIAYEGEASYREGILSFKVKAGDNTTFEFTGSLSDEDTLSGVFTVTAWFVVRDAVTGDWLLVRQ
ncbi:MAG: hypothetical protein JXB35_06205, partial [Anaerolineae bacterium]|nr:hypothetical protein [Anaerolineae bacterium]